MTRAVGVGVGVILLVGCRAPAPEPPGGAGAAEATEPEAAPSPEPAAGTEHPDPEPCAVARWQLSGTPDFSLLIEQVEARMKVSGTPGAAVAVAVDGKILWEQGFGWANRKRRVRADAHTPFSLASVSKPFTATAIMILAERGQLDLDAPVNRYLEGRGVWAGAGDPEDATIRRLLAHRAGLPTYARFYFLDHADPPVPVPEVVARHGMLASPPGERHNYSNLGYGILGEVVSVASNTSYAGFLRQALLDPLGLHDVSVGPPKRDHRAAVRYAPGGEPIPTYTVDHPAASSLHASVHDLARFGMFHLGQLPEADRILGADSRAAMRDPLDPSDHYGLGFGVGRNDGKSIVFHDGQMHGVSASLQLFPEYGVVLAIAGNTDRFRDHFGVIQLETLLALGMPARADPICARGPSQPLVGAWTGTLHGEGGQTPVGLQVSEDGEVRIRIGDRPWAEVHRVSVENTTLVGLFRTDAGLPSGEGPSGLRLEVTLREDGLGGTLHTMSFWDGWTPYWITLERAAGDGEDG